MHKFLGMGYVIVCTDSQDGEVSVKEVYVGSREEAQTYCDQRNKMFEGIDPISIQGHSLAVTGRDIAQIYGG